MRLLSYLTSLLLALSISACGGGGGSAGTTSGSVPVVSVFSTSAPLTIALDIGAVQEYSIQGGYLPYTIKNSNPNTVAGFFRNGSLIVNPVGQGQGLITLVDGKGTTIPIDVTVGAALQLSITNVKSFVGDVVTVIITGGTPPYRVSSLDLAIKAAIIGNKLILTLGALSETDVVVLDARDKQVKLTVTVIDGTPQIRMSPNAVTVSETDTQPIIFTLFGAVAGPITVKSSDPTLLQASVVGNIVTVVTGTNGDRCVSADRTVTFQVTDSKPASAFASVTVRNSLGGCSDLLAPVGDFVVQAGTSRSVVVGGDASGGYSVSSSNQLVATASIANGILTINGIPYVCPTPLSPAGTCPSGTPATRPATITVTNIASPQRSITVSVIVNS